MKRVRIISEHAKVTTMCNGMEGYDAEVELEEMIDDKFNTIFISGNASVGLNYGVSKFSVFGDVTDNFSFLEEYESLEEAEKSEYYKYFLIVDRMLDEITDFGNGDS